jgi:hypothetical protein
MTLGHRRRRRAVAAAVGNAGAAATPLTDPETWSVPAPPPAARCPSERSSSRFSASVPLFHGMGSETLAESGFPTARKGRPGVTVSPSLNREGVDVSV